VELTVTEAIALGHNYVGCEHLLLGLISEPDGTAGQVLRSLGAELRSTRRAVVAALAGYVHLRAQAAGGSPAVPADATKAVAAAVRQELQPVIGRIERLEQHVGLTGSSR
jgi:ATP-dependent Clp protease ATP-binding subunit ClpC